MFTRDIPIRGFNTYSRKLDAKFGNLVSKDPNKNTVNTFMNYGNKYKYEEERVTLDKYTIIEQSRTRVVYNWLQYFDRDSIRKEFDEVGFRVEEFYSDVAGTSFSPESSDIAIVARKRSDT